MKHIKILFLILCLPLWLLFPSGAFAQGIEIQSGASIINTGSPTIEIVNGGFINHGTYTKGSETVTFSGTIPKTISGVSTTEMYKLTLANTGGMTIDAGTKLTVSNTLSNTAGIAGLVIQSTSDGVAGAGSLINGTTVVPATVQRWMTGSSWHLISPTATGQTVADFVADAANGIPSNTATNNYALAPYLETDNTWYYYNPTKGQLLGSLDSPGKGYQVLRNTAGIVSFKGTLAGADQSVPLVKAGSGWNLIGNPFPCALDINLFLNHASNVTAIDPSYLGIYVSNLATDGYTVVNKIDVPTLKLALGEGFFVKSAATPGSVAFTSAMKSHTSDAFKAAVIQPGIELIAKTGNLQVNTLVKYISGTTEGLDPGYDAGLFSSNAASFSLYTRLVQDNGVDFMLQCLPTNGYENLVIPVGLTATQGTVLQFQLGSYQVPENYKVYLEDRLMQTYTRLDESGSFYNVTLDTQSNGTGRFYLHTKTALTNLEGSLTHHLKFIPLPQQQLIRVSGWVNLPAQAMVYDLNGRMIATKSLSSLNENMIPFRPVSNGIYLVRIKSAKENHQQKIIWNL